MGQPPAPASLLIRIDPRSREALQQQIYAGIQRAILEGVVSPGTRLPSSRELAVDLGVSRTTTLLALEQLVAEGYVTARRGSGTFVARDLPDDLRRARRPRHRRSEASAAVETGCRSWADAGSRLARWRPASALSHRNTRGGHVSRGALVAAREPTRAVGHARAARLRRGRRPSKPPRGDRQSRGRGPGDRVRGVDGRAWFPGGPKRAAGGRGPDRPGAGRRRRPRRGGGGAARGQGASHQPRNSIFSLGAPNSCRRDALLRRKRWPSAPWARHRRGPASEPTHSTRWGLSASPSAKFPLRWPPCAKPVRALSPPIPKSARRG